MNIIIVRYKNPEVEERCIKSVEQFTDLSRHKLTVFDNSPENINLGKLWNKLIEASNEEVICLLNSDTVVEEGWADKLEESINYDIDLGAVGPITDNCGTVQKNMKRGEELEYVNDLSGFCYVFRKSVWKEVGGFPEDMPFYGQESIFNRKLQERDHDLRVDRRVFIHHEKGASYKKAIERGETTNAEEYWGAFHYYNYLDRLKILRSIVKPDFKIIVIGGGRNNPFPLHRGMEQAVNEFFGTNGLILKEANCIPELIDLFKPDFVMNTETKYDENVDEFLRYAKKQGAKTALYYNDMRCPVTDACKAPETLCKDLTDIYDALFICNEGHIDCWRQTCKVPVYYMPQGSIQHPKPVKGEKHHILHIGSESPGPYHQNRHALLRDLRRTLEIKNKNSSDRDIRARIQNESYGDYHSSDYSLAISMEVPKYTSDRLYTITGAGGCALVFNPGGLDDIFKNGEHVLFFKTAEEARKIIARTTEEERETIKLNAFKYTQKHHQYRNRLLNILANLLTEDKTFWGDRNNLKTIGK